MLIYKVSYSRTLGKKTKLATLARLRLWLNYHYTRSSWDRGSRYGTAAAELKLIQRFGC